MLAGQADIERAAGDREGVARVERVDEDRAVGLTDLRGEARVAVRRIQRDERLFLVEDAAEGVWALSARIPALDEVAASQAAVFGSGLVKDLDVEIQRGVGGGELVALRRSGLETAIEHALALPVGIVIRLALVLLSSVLTIEVVTLVEGVLRAVVEAGHRSGKIEEGKRGAQLPFVVAGVARILDADAVDVVIVDESDQTGGAFAVEADIVQLAGELTAAGAVDENALDRLAHREEERGIKGEARLFAVAG